MSRDLQVLSARRARAFLALACALTGTSTPRLPRAGSRLLLSVERGAGLESWIVERRAGEGAARYSVCRVRNVAIDAVTLA